MPKYLDADKAKEFFRKMSFESSDAEAAKILTKFAHFAIPQIIDNSRGEHVAKIIHAFWEEVQMQPNSSVIEFRCSHCGKTFCFDGRYCPNCGARMDEWFGRLKL